MMHRAAPWLLWAAGPAMAAQVYGIGQTAASQSFPTPKAFTEAVACVRGGDRIVLEAGRVHPGPLTLTLCPEAGRGVVEVTATGGGTKTATLDASVLASDLGLSWQPRPDGEAAPSVAVVALGPLPGRPVQVLGTQGPLRPARWPNASSTGDTPLARLATVRKQGQACDAWLCVAPAGAEWGRLIARLAAAPPVTRPDVVLRNSPWSYTRHEIVSVDTSSGLLGLAPARGSTGTAEDKDFIQPGTGFQLQGGKVALDQSGEWWFDAETRTLLVALERKSAAETAAALRVTLAAASGGAVSLLSVQPRGRQSETGITLRVQGLTLANAAGSALTGSGLGGVDIDNVRILNAVENGIAISGVDRLSVQRSEVIGTGNNGILAIDVKDLQLRSNKVSDAGRVGLQPQLTTQFNGIRAAGFARVDIGDNEITGVGYAGIMLAERGAFESTADLRPALRVERNRVADFCRLLNDCGAIYINGGKRGQKPVPGAGPSVQKLISGNRIGDPRPSMSGLPGDGGASSPTGDKSGAWVRMVGAVYLDHGASGYDIRDNSVDGEYTPFGWAVFNGGIENACSREAVTQCKGGAKAYRCYTDALAQCNQAPARPSK